MGTIPGNVESGRVPLAGVGQLLARWQAGHDLDDFAALVAIVREPLVRMAARTLRRIGIRDPGACDDVVALVLERLFRLGACGDARAPPAFERGRVDPDAVVDPGWAFVRCIARSRARDCARALRRRERIAAGYAAATAVPGAAVVDEPGADGIDVDRLHAVVATLDGRSRWIVELLLEGKSQAVIAHVLGVCEGTVSRLRAKAVARLRVILAAEKRGGVLLRLSRRPRSARRG